jgi:hypothetical protein
MRPVYVSSNLIDCELVKSYLEDNGIQAVVHHQHAALSEGASGFPTVGVVRDDDEPRALQIIAQRGKEDATLPPWHCERCREENEGPFGLCWKCGASAPPL